MDPIIIRASSLSTYVDCPRRAACSVEHAAIVDAGYVLRTLPRHIGASTGTATHAGAEHILKNKLDGRALVGVNDASEAAINSLDGELAKETTWDDTTPNRNAAQHQVVRQVAQFWLDAEPLIEPTAVEERLSAELEPGVVATGRVDCREIGRLDDLKTGRKRANAAQYGLYALIAEAHGHIIADLREIFIKRVRLTATQPAAEMIEYDTDSAKRAAMAIAGRMISDINEFRDTEDPWSFLANPRSMLCSDRFCPAHGTEFCHEWKK